MIPRCYFYVIQYYGCEATLSLSLMGHAGEGHEGFRIGRTGGTCVDVLLGVHAPVRSKLNRTLLGPGSAAFCLSSLPQRSLRFMAQAHGALYYQEVQVFSYATRFAYAGGSARYTRSRTLERNDRCNVNRWSIILGANGDLQMPRAPCSRKTTRAPQCTYIYTVLLSKLVCTLIGTYLVCCFVPG